MSDQQRDRILGCACDLYLEHGLDGFSMRKLAKEVGVTAPALYRHYDGREEVLADVLREAHRTFSRYLYSALGAPSPQERFSAAGEQYLNFVIDHPRWYGMMHTAPEHLGMEQIPEDIAGLQAATSQFWLDRVRECMEAGILRQGDPMETAITMWAHAHGMVQLYHQRHLSQGVCRTAQARIVSTDGDFHVIEQAFGNFRLAIEVIHRHFRYGPVHRFVVAGC